jgi:hypothetical protein
MARGPRIGRERDRDIAFRQRRRQRFGREQMPAGAAGRDQNARRCLSCHCPAAQDRIQDRIIVGRHGCLLEHFQATCAAVRGDRGYCDPSNPAALMTG